MRRRQLTRLAHSLTRSPHAADYLASSHVVPPRYRSEVVGHANALRTYALTPEIANEHLQAATEEPYRSRIGLYFSGVAGLGFRCGEIYMAVNRNSARFLAAAGSEGLLLDPAFGVAMTDAVRAPGGPPRLIRLMDGMLGCSCWAMSRAGDAAIAAGDRDKLVRLGASCFIESSEVMDVVAAPVKLSSIAAIASDENAEAWTRVRRFAFVFSLSS